MSILLLFVGCASPLQAVRVRGAEILHCPAQHLAIERTGDIEFKAEGCGYSIALRCASPEDGPCNPAPLVRAPGLAPDFAFSQPGRVMTAISEPIFTQPPPQAPPSQPYRPAYTPPPQTHLYMPGQYNPNIGAVQHDYAHQYTRPYTPPPPVYTPPPYHAPTYTYHH
jgi:hypothetical protein